MTGKPKRKHSLADRQLELQLRANPPMVMTAEECAIVTTLHIDTIYQKVAEGTFPHRKEGRRVLFLWEQVRACLRGEWKP